MCVWGGGGRSNFILICFSLTPVLTTHKIEPITINKKAEWVMRAFFVVLMTSSPFCLVLSGLVLVLSLSGLVLSLSLSCPCPCLVWSSLVLSCLVWSGLVWSCLVLSCLVLRCVLLSCLALSCVVFSCRVMSCRAVSCCVLSCALRLSCVLSCLLSRLVSSSEDTIGINSPMVLLLMVIARYIYIYIYIPSASVLGAWRVRGFGDPALIYTY